MRHVIGLPLSRAQTLHKNTPLSAWRPIRSLHLGFLSTQVAVYRHLTYGQASGLWLQEGSVLVPL